MPECQGKVNDPDPPSVGLNNRSSDQQSSPESTRKTEATLLKPMTTPFGHIHHQVLSNMITWSRPRCSKLFPKYKNRRKKNGYHVGLACRRPTTRHARHRETVGLCCRTITSRFQTKSSSFNVPRGRYASLRIQLVVK